MPTGWRQHNGTQHNPILIGLKRLRWRGGTQQSTQHIQNSPVCSPQQHGGNCQLVHNSASPNEKGGTSLEPFPVIHAACILQRQPPALMTGGQAVKDACCLNHICEPLVGLTGSRLTPHHLLACSGAFNAASPRKRHMLRMCRLKPTNTTLHACPTSQGAAYLTSNTCSKQRHLCEEGQLIPLHPCPCVAGFGC